MMELFCWSRESLTTVRHGSFGFFEMKIDWRQIDEVANKK